MPFPNASGSKAWRMSKGDDGSIADGHAITGGDVDPGRCHGSTLLGEQLGRPTAIAWPKKKTLETQKRTMAAKPVLVRRERRRQFRAPERDAASPSTSTPEAPPSMTPCWHRRRRSCSRHLGWPLSASGRRPSCRGWPPFGTQSHRTTNACWSYPGCPRDHGEACGVW